MSQSYRIYLDACCLNRPFDAQTQPRIALETQAVLAILSQCQAGTWKLITSTALDEELDQMRDLEKLNNVKTILSIAKIKVLMSSFIEQRMPKTQQEVIRQGYKALIDSLGVVDAMRFIQHFSPGQGDYTQERREWVDQTLLTDILTAMKQRQGEDTEQYDEIIE
jgi:hypothetical protein